MADLFSSLLGGLFGPKPDDTSGDMLAAVDKTVDIYSAIFSPISSSPNIVQVAYGVASALASAVAQPVQPVQLPPLDVSPPPSPEEIWGKMKAETDTAKSILRTVPSSSELTFLDGGRGVAQIIPGSTLPPIVVQPGYDPLRDAIGVSQTPVSIWADTPSASPGDTSRGATYSAPAGGPGGRYGSYMKSGRYILSADTWGLAQKSSFGSAADFMKEDPDSDFYDVVGYTSLKLVVRRDGSYSIWSRAGTTKIAQIRSSGGPESIKYVDPLEQAGFEVRSSVQGGLIAPAIGPLPDPSSTQNQLQGTLPGVDPVAQMAELMRLAEEGRIDPLQLSEGMRVLEGGLITTVENVSISEGREAIQSVRDVVQSQVPGGTLPTPVQNPKDVVDSSKANQGLEDQGLEDLKSALKGDLGPGR